MALQRIEVVTWSPLDPVSAAKLSKMVANDTLLQANMVRGLYSGYGASKQQGVRVVSGIKAVNTKKAQSANAIVSYNGAFSAGCKPVISTGVFSKTQRDITITLSGRGSAAVLPDHTGFDIHARLLKKATCSFYVTWIAVGW